MQVLKMTPADIRGLRVTGIGENHVDINDTTRWVGSPREIARALVALGTRVACAAAEWEPAPEGQPNPFPGPPASYTAPVVPPSERIEAHFKAYDRLAATVPDIGGRDL